MTAARRRKKGSASGGGAASPISARDVAVGALLVALSLILRLVLLNDGLFHHDAVRLAQAVEESHRTGHLQPMWLQEPPVAGRYGLVFVNWMLYAVARPIFDLQSSERVLMVSAALFGSLAVGALYTIAREIGGGRAAAAGGAILCSLSPIFFSESVGAKGHALGLFLALSGIAFALRAARVRSTAIAIVAGVLAGASGFARETSAYSAIAGALALLVHDRESRQRLLIWFLLASGVVIATLVVVQWDWFRLFARVTGYQGLSPRLMGLALRDVNYAITPAGFVLLGLGIAASLGQRRSWGLWIWMAAHFLYSANLAQYSSRFLIESLAVASLFIARGVDWTLGRWRPVYWLGIAALAVIPFVRTWDVIAYRHDRIGNKEVAELIRMRTPPDAVVIAMDDAPFVNYYGQRETLLHPIANPKDIEGTRGELETFVRQVANLLLGGRRVYVLKTGFSYDPGELVARLLHNNFDFVEVARMESEDFHDKSIVSGRYEQVIWELKVKAKDGS